MTPEDLKAIAVACEAQRLEAEQYWNLIVGEPPEGNRKALRAINLMANGAHALRTWCLDQLAGRQPVIPPSCHPADVLPATMEPEAVVHVEPFGSECVTSSSVQVSAANTTS